MTSSDGISREHHFSMPSLTPAVMIAMVSSMKIAVNTRLRSTLSVANQTANSFIPAMFASDASVFDAIHPATIE